MTTSLASENSLLFRPPPAFLMRQRLAAISLAIFALLCACFVLATGWATFDVLASGDLFGTIFIGFICACGILGIRDAVGGMIHKWRFSDPRYNFLRIEDNGVVLMWDGEEATFEWADFTGFSVEEVRSSVLQFLHWKKTLRLHFVVGALTDQARARLARAKNLQGKAVEELCFVVPDVLAPPGQLVQLLNERRQASLVGRA